ncbi:exopolysaccharide biosynthesis protein [Hyphococcus luteus]|uniref:Polysaccharide synthesis protein exod n=1 Tax=Hyphococcus luteus TaxID=2058213 RepID=A0A2S7K6L2_9PROT|nr:exopolysaccharide biosynthesis protein [Marinicaulis flavus]PQA88150.1 polysaccharide synthesis protein exod [Marinicaulis flavus]
MTENGPTPKEKMRGATRVLHDILDDLKRAAPETAAASSDAAAAPTAAPSAALGDVVDRLDERAFGFLLLLLALPCCLPFVYLLPQIVALPMLALAGQMAMGTRHPWLPQKLHDRRFEIAAFSNVLARAEKYGGWLERIATPRLRPVTSHLALRIIGGLMLLPIASILMPFPLTNTVPGIGVAIAALGIIERDGVLVTGGLLIGFIWVLLLIFVGAETLHLVKDWLTGGA